MAHGRELERVAAGSRATQTDRCADAHQVDIGRLWFSAKEAVYKAWFPLAGRWLGFEDVELSVDLADTAFSAALLVPGPVVDGARLTELRGRWVLEDGLVGTAVVVPAGSRLSPDGPRP